MSTSRIYLPTDTWEPGLFPAMLAIGDSWFWYPRNNVLQALVEHKRLKDPYRIVQMLGYNGAKLEEYVFGRHAKQLEKHLSAGFRGVYSAILVSGAGNDAVDYRLALKRNCSGMETAEECIDEDTMAVFIGKLSAALSALLQRIADAYAGGPVQRPDIFLHSYDYPVPDGRGFKLADLKITGPWLRPAMEVRRVDGEMALRRAICRILIDRLAKMYEGFAATHERVYFIRSAGCLVSANHEKDWDNELHPTQAGFGQVVDKCWIPVLARHGYAKS
ncbi:hypothetical protein [Thauera sinica]|uniref:SGNH hydrolase-type esterase domain-containing protein n=1 Tax=Thauera sinica TaxID=2665146 RepID=A0ABW1APE5_9RHOO|nr:hypothetical protein [Thauera sp. K11]ATE62232.1 hypothetical protein CCZ27_21645 [Thauera sp. K11]